MPTWCQQFGGVETESTAETRRAIFRHRVRGAVDEVEALSFVEANAPSTYTGLQRKRIKITQLPDRHGNIYDAEIEYDSFPKLEVGQQIIKISGGGKTVTRTYDITTLETQGDLTIADLGGAINVNQDGEPEGVDVYIPTDKMTIERGLAAGTLTLAYIASLRAARGAVNDQVWNGFAAGEVQFTDYEAVSGGADMDRISYTFEIEPNADNGSGGYDIAGYTFSQPKQGWDYVSVGSAVKYDKTKNVRIPVARWAAMHRVLPRADFLAILGF